MKPSPAPFKPLVFDEGMLTSLRITMTDEHRPFGKDVLRRLVPATDLVAVVEVPSEVAYERVGERIAATGEQPPLSQAIALLHPTTPAIGNSVEWATRSVTDSLLDDRIRLDGTRPVAENGAIVASALRIL